MFTNETNAKSESGNLEQNDNSESSENSEIKVESKNKMEKWEVQEKETLKLQKNKEKRNLQTRKLLKNPNGNRKDIRQG